MSAPAVAAAPHRSGTDLHLKQWKSTAYSNVFQCVETRHFHFVCETELFDETPYETFYECRRALHEHLMMRDFA